MTPDEALAKIDSIGNGLREITVGLCRITALHPDEYRIIVKNPDIYHRLIDINYHVANLREYIEKNKERME